MGAALTIGSLAAGGMAATPLTTIPWNGHIGAVSFTFDDAMENQVQNLGPILEEMPDAKVTFFISSGSDYFKRRGGDKEFAKLAKAGHEIGNHSLTHSNLPTLANQPDSLKAEIVDHAESLEKIFAAAGADIKISSFATPYCASGEADGPVIKSIGEHHFINRDCSDWGYRHAWDKELKWFQMPALGWSRSGKKPEDITVAMDTCIGNANFSGLKSWETPPGPEGEWMVVLIHGVADDGDDLSIDPADFKKISQHAIDNKMWVAPFGTVGAYMKAHFTLDSAAAIAVGSGGVATDAKSGTVYKVAWTLPHPHMPASIPLKVKLNEEFLKEAGWDDIQKIRIEQNGKAIAPTADGIFEIEFTALELTIRKADASSLPNDTVPEINNPDTPTIGSKDSTETSEPEAISKTRTAGSNPAVQKSQFDAKGRAVPESYRTKSSRPTSRVYRFSLP